MPSRTVAYSARVDEALAFDLSRRWWNELWREGRIDVADEIVADPIVRHSSTGTFVTSRDDYKRQLAEFQRTLCKPETTIDDRSLEGDRLWTRATSRGINRETGEPSIVTWLMVQRIVDGRIAEQWTMTAWGVDWSG